MGKNIKCHPGAGRDLFTLKHKIPAFAGMTLFFVFAFFVMTAWAEEEAEIIEKSAHTYAPSFCDFEVSFPDAPYTSRRCDANNPDNCYNIVSYTKVFDMASTVNFRIVCNPISQEVYEAYSPDILKATLRAMTKQSVVDEFNSSYREEETYKQAGLVGEGMSGRTPTVYIAQLWVGQNSALSVEAELIGESSEDADKLLSDVLKSVGPKQGVNEQDGTDADPDLDTSAGEDKE